MSLLEVEGLGIRYPGGAQALSDVGFALKRGGSLAVVGESGAGKTSLALAVAGLLDPATLTGSVRFDGMELVGLTEDELRPLRWRRLAYAPQGTPFNPTMTLEKQVAEPLRLHLGLDSKEASGRAAELATEVGLDPALLRRHPHEVSGGQLRLALLAMAMGCEPELVILDEPGAGLDVLTGDAFFRSLREAAERRGFALIVITHDLPAASRICAQTLVLYAARVTEIGATAAVIGRPAHPYTWALLNAYPVMSTSKDLRPIRGLAPDVRQPPSGCHFHPRCPQVEPICVTTSPPLEEHRGRRIACLLGGVQPVLRVENIAKTFRVGGMLHAEPLPAVRGVSFEVLHGEVVGVIGPSGSGKTTIARIAAGLLRPDSGRVLVASPTPPSLDGQRSHFRGEDLATLSPRRLREVRRRIQLVSQHPEEALSPRLRVLELVREPLDIVAEGPADERRERCLSGLRQVGLEPHQGLLDAYAHQLSGGQQQRVAIARALVARPRLLVADEPTSMLDASEQARLLQLLKELQVERGMGLILVSHDIALVRKVADRIIVVDAGAVVEEGASGLVSSAPREPLTRRLVDASPAFLEAAEPSP